MGNETLKVDDWIPARDAWSAFCEAHPHLRLKGSPGSWIWFQRTVLPILAEQKLALKAPGRNWLVHRDKFDEQVFNAMMRGPVIGQ